MRAILITLGTIIILIGGLSVCLRITNERAKVTNRPYGTYTRLIGVASDCELYSRQYGRWPNSLAELRAFRPELKDWAKDMWGHDVKVVPYDKSLGYGEVISYGGDGILGGIGADRDLVVRYPLEPNAEWNKQLELGLKQSEVRP